MALDGNMNVALANAVEYIRGEPKKTFEDAFIRGNNGKNIFLI